MYNRYRIVKLLGQGGFGTMYRAWDTTLGRPCALKENLDAAPEIQQQFLQEAKILANLNHPNLPRVSDYFIEGQAQYLVMDYIEGRDLQEMLEARGAPLPEDQVLPWIRQICEALTYLHTQKPPIIHRDIKPANIRITPTNTAMLVDFGIAKVHDPSTKTALGAQAVTPGYSPYEQYGKGATDARTDVYALGATLYTLLTGTEPPESVQRVASVLTPGRDPLVLPRQRNPAITVRTSAAIIGALQMDPAQRLQSVADFKAALGPARRPDRLVASPPPPSSPAQPLPARPALPWGWMAAVAGLLVVVLFLLVAVLRRPPGGEINHTQPAPGFAADRSRCFCRADAAGHHPHDHQHASTFRDASDYIVSAGDTCSEIAQQFGVSVRSIVSLNDLPADCAAIYAGQTLFIPPALDAEPDQRPCLRDSFATPVTPVATQVSQADGMTLVYVPSGEFLMGSPDSDIKTGQEEKPQHPVYLSVYWIDQTEVTNAMYSRCVRSGVCRPPRRRARAPGRIISTRPVLATIR